MPVYKWSKTAATNASADSTVNWAEGMAPSAVNDSARAEMAAVAKFRDDISGTLTTTGSSTAYALTTNSVFDTAANMSGAMITFIPHATSGASPTLAVDGLTARAINKSTGVAVATGQLIIGTPYVVSYIHATTEFVLQGYTEVFGNVTVNGTTLLTGAVTLSSTLAVTGNVSVNTNKFTVTAASGNTLVAGTLDATGNLAVNTNKFNVAAASGNTTVAGTLGVTGKTTISGLANFASAAYASATAGDIEYDGKAFAALPVASDRGIMPSIHFLRLSSDQAGSNVNTAQTWFPGGGSTSYNAPASTAFFFEGLLMFSRAAGSTSHTISVGLGGSATFTSINGELSGINAAGNVIGQENIIRFDTAAAVVIINANTLTNENVIMRYKGIMSVNGAGTIIPQFTYSAAPGGAPTIKANSYFKLFPIGVDTVVSVGNWS